MADIKTVISGIIDIQDKTISKLKYNSDAVVTMSGVVESLSSDVSTISTNIGSLINEDVLSGLLSGAYSNEYVSLTGNTTLENGKRYLCEVTSGLTITLPSGEDNKFIQIAAQSLDEGKSIIINSTGSQKIDNQTSLQLDVSYSSVKLVYDQDNLNWNVVSPFLPNISSGGTVSGDYVTHDELSAFHTYDNMTYTNKIYVCGNGIAGYETFKEISNFETTYEIKQMKASYYDFSWIIDGTVYYAYANDSTKFGMAYTLPQLDAGFTYVAFGKDQVYGISDGKMYVIGHQRLSNTATNTSEGSLLGTTLVPSKTAWTQASTDITNWYFVDAHYGSVAALAGDGLSGTLYMAGYNQYMVLGTAGNGQTTKNYTSNIYNTYLLNTLTPITLVENSSRITPNDWVKVEKGHANVLAQRANGKIYTWGSNICGCNGDGTGYWNDMTNAEVSGVTNGSVTRTIDFGRVQPEVLKVREYASNYDADTNPTAYTDVQYTDWIDFSHSWYHAVAVRKDTSTNISYVYIWGANEYGQFGNGNYVEAALVGGDIGDSAHQIQVRSRPVLLTTDLFPYTDVVKVKATHYGTYLIREGGQIYFAGSNKRNCLGLYSNSSGLDTFITKFTQVSYLGEFDAETYGAMETRSIPELKETADELMQSVLSGSLAPQKLADASVMAHNHSINPSLIDSVVTTTSNYVSYFPDLLTNEHTHINASTLSKLTDQNGVLLLDGQPISTGTSTGGTVLEIDPSNVKLDSFASILGMSNIAGGYPLDVISYQADNTNNKSYLVVGQMRQGSMKDFDRWPAIYKKSGTTYSSFMTSDQLRKGGWGIVYKSTSITSGNILSSFLLTSTGSVKDFIETVNKSSAYRGYIYDLTAMDKTNWAGGTAIKSAITSSAYPKASMFVKYQTGLLNPNSGLGTVINSDSEYIPLTGFSGFSIGSAHASEQSTKYQNVYSSDGTLLISSSIISAGVYNNLGQKVKYTSQLLSVSGYNIVDDESVAVYYDYYDNESLTGTSILLGSTISAGLYKKTGTVYNKLTNQDAIDLFDDSLFEVGGQIYIKPTKSDFTGVANQRYEIEQMVPISSTTSGSADYPYPLEYMILKLNSVVINDNETPSSVTYTPGYAGDPMMAIVKTKKRNSTSEVGGEYNAAIGSNAIAQGNNNATFGDWAVTYGLCNTNNGQNAFVYGLNNGVTASNSYIFGEGNEVAGSYAFIWGNTNGNDGQDAFIIGTRNFNSGVDNVIIGSGNEVDGNRNFVVGTRNYIAQNKDQNIILGTTIYSDVRKMMAFGWNGQIQKFEGNFPTDDEAVTMSASVLQAGIDAGTYVSGGLYYQNSFHICMGDKITKQEDKHLDVLTYTKYRWQVNDSYFALANTSSARSGKQPKLIVPDHRWTFTGKMFMNFTEAELASGSTDTFDVTIRNGGRVKTCDPGLIITDSSTTLDFDKAYKFKIKVSGSFVPTLENWVDGAEGYIAVYGGTDISWPATWNFTNTAPSSMASSSSTSFALVKIMIIDTTIIATTIGTF